MNGLLNKNSIGIQLGVSIDSSIAIKTYEEERGKIHTDDVRKMAYDAVQIANELLATNDLHSVYLGLGRIVTAGAMFGAWLESALKDILIGKKNLDPGSEFMKEVKRRFIIKHSPADLVQSVLSGRL